MLAAAAPASMLPPCPPWQQPLTGEDGGVVAPEEAAHQRRHARVVQGRRRLGAAAVAKHVVVPAAPTRATRRMRRLFILQQWRPAPRPTSAGCRLGAGDPAAARPQRHSREQVRAMPHLRGSWTGACQATGQGLAGTCGPARCSCPSLFRMYPRRRPACLPSGAPHLRLAGRDHQALLAPLRHLRVHQGADVDTDIHRLGCRAAVCRSCRRAAAVDAAAQRLGGRRLLSRLGHRHAAGWAITLRAAQAP